MNMERSPVRSDLTTEQTPPTKRERAFSDRFVPCQTRKAIDFSIYAEPKKLVLPIEKGQEKSDVSSNDGDQKSKFITINEKQYNMAYKSIIANELSDAPKENLIACDDDQDDAEFKRSSLQFSQKRWLYNDGSVFSTSPSSPFSDINQKILQRQVNTFRKIPTFPYKVLDAPGLPNDFYLNLLDWSKSDVVAVALANKVYLWDSISSRVVNLMNNFHLDHNISCVKWSQDYPNVLAFTTSNGTMYLYDVQQFRFFDKRQVFASQRVGCIEWNSNLITTGSRDGIIRSYDMRASNPVFANGNHGHNLEVCGLKWDSTQKILASGGNDNKICLWDIREDTPLCCLNGHQGAVKALAWSPHDPSLLASGGGSADRCIKFWNTKTNVLTNSVDTRSQVCNLYWSTTDKELLSTHGFSSNTINIWKYPSMDQLISLKGHTSRVIYFSVSPDEEKIVTGSSDETLRFWNVFPKNSSKFKLTELDSFSFSNIR